MCEMPKKLVVLYGGESKESTVSKKTAKSVMSALNNAGFSTIPLEFDAKTWVEDVLEIKPDFVFNAMHGCPGEDGVVQATLDMLHIPYQGSGFQASYKAMDKYLSKRVFEKEGLSVAKDVLFTTKEMPEQAPFLPAFLKPNFGGSSVDAYSVETVQQWQDVRSKIKKNNHSEELWLLEEYVSGKELTVPVIGSQAQGVLEIALNTSKFFDYQVKYTDGMVEYIYPASIATEVAKKAHVLAEKAHNSLGCCGVSRVDFLYEEKTGRLVVLEVNTLPGMTEFSLVPKVADKNGLSYLDLIIWMIKDGLSRTMKDDNEQSEKTT